MKKAKLLTKIFIMIFLLLITSVCMAEDENNRGEYTYQAGSGIDTGKANAFFIEANKACKAGRYDEAISLYDKAIEINPKYSSAYTNRGVAHAGKRQFDEAINDYNEALRLNPQDAAAYNGRAIVYIKTGRHGEAKENLREAIRVNQKFADAYYNLGLITQNNASEAIENFNLFLIYAKPGDSRIEEAKKTIRELQANEQENVPVTNKGANNNNSNGQTPSANPNIQNNQFPTTWNGLKLTKSGTMPSKLSLDMNLDTNAVIRGIIIKQPRTTVSDNGTLKFYLNNGDAAGITFFQDDIGFSFSWTERKWFDKAIWNNGLYKSSYYNSSIALYTPGDGYLYVDVIPLNPALQSKSYKFELPEGAQYFNGKCYENVLIGEIGLYQ